MRRTSQPQLKGINVRQTFVKRALARIGSVLLFLLGLVLGISAKEKPTAQVAMLGLTKETALEVCLSSGEREYLARLRCSDGGTSTYRRLGSFGPRHDPPEDDKEIVLRQLDEHRVLGPDETDYHVIDVYAVYCEGDTFNVYFDMYHCRQPPPAIAVHGFSFEGVER